MSYASSIRFIVTVGAVSLVCQSTLAQQGMGIGNNNPLEMLDVSGAIKLGTDINNSNAAPSGGAGTIRFRAGQFEGWDGTTWIPLGGGGGTSPFTLAGNVVLPDNTVVDLATDDFIFGSPSLDDDSNAAHDGRFFYDKSKGAFRAGLVTGDQWNDLKRGHQSFAAGFDVTASGDYSIALGERSWATATGAIAMGRQAYAEGEMSFAWGNDVQATGTGSVALGKLAFSTANYSYAVGTDVDATAEYSMAVGARANATDIYAIALGSNVNANAESAFVLGHGSSAGALEAAAIGYGVLATGEHSVGLGHDLLALSEYEVVLGRYNDVTVPLSATNWEPTDRLFSIGNGIDAANRSNALTILKNGNTGIGTTTPSATFHVDGIMRYVDGNQQAGHIPVSDANGNMTWTDPATITTGNDGDWTVSGNDQYSAVSGNVGIGTTTPETRLHVASTTTGNTTGIKLTQASSNSLIYHNADNDLVIQKAAHANQFVLNSSGSIGIGTDAPSVRLQVEGSIRMVDGNQQAGRIPVSSANGTMVWTDPTAVVTAADGDGDASNELQTLSQTGTSVTLSNGGGTISVADNDNDSSNEIQDLSLSGNTLSLSGDATPVDLSGFVSTDDQNLTGATLTGTTLQIDIEGGSSTSVNLASLVNDADADATNELQILSISGSDITLSNGGGTVSLPNDGDWTVSGSDQYSAVSGRVGIGTTTPDSKLQVVGNVIIGADGQTNTGANSLVVGTNNSNTGQHSIIGGNSHTVTGTHVLVSGYDHTVAANNSVVLNNNNSNTAAATNSLVGGYNSSVSGQYALSYGWDSQASGTASVALGYSNNTIGAYGFAGNTSNVVSGDRATGFGNNNRVRSYGEFVAGLFNTDYTPASATSINPNDRVFTVGNGLSDALRSNAMVILKNGNTGIGSSTPSDKLHVEGSIRMVDGNQQTGYIPVSDANGKMVWTDPATITTAADGDGDASNELQTLSQTGTSVTLSNGGGTISVADNDNDATNELQILSISGSDITLSNGGGTVSLPNDGDWTVSGSDQYSAVSGRVGIGTTTPDSKLQVVGNVIIGADGQTNTGGNSLVVGVGNSNSGQNSVIAGNSHTVTGTHVFTSGFNHTVAANSSVALNSDNIITGAATYSLVGGYSSEVTGQYGFAFGWDNTTSGQAAASFGRNNTASGQYSFAANASNTVSGVRAAAFGQQNDVSGEGSFATGKQNSVSATKSLVTGEVNTVSGSQSLVAGNSNTVSGTMVFTSGNFNQVSGDASSALGRGLRVRSYGETVAGVFNTDYTPINATGINVSDRVFVVGNGTADNARSNALTVLKSGNVGVGSDIPEDKLHVDGSIRMVDGNQQAGYIPVSDANGKMTWTDPNGIVTNEAWGLAGNAGTDNANNFIGTTDSQGFVIRTNNTQRMKVRDNGVVEIGSNDFNLLSGVDEYARLIVRDHNGLLSNIAQYCTGSGYPAHDFINHRGTYTSPTPTQTNDPLGEISGKLYNGTSIERAAAIRLSADGTISGDAPGKISFYTRNSASASLSERMVIKKDGKVGIGTTAPEEILHIERTTGDAIVKIESPGSSYEARLEVHKFGGFSAGVGYYAGNADLRLRTNTNNSIVFEPNGTERMRVSNSGNVGIGTTAPGSKLDVEGDIDVNANGIKFTDTENSNAIIELRASDPTYPDQGVTLRTLTNPPSGEPIFRVLSSGGAERLRVEHDGAVAMNNTIRIEGGSPANGKVLTATDNLGNAVWSDVAGSNELIDADGDTKIQVEESADEDMIRFDLAGTQQVRIRTNGNGAPMLELNPVGGNLYIGTDVGVTDAGSFNTFIGQFAGDAHNTGSDNTMIGSDAGTNNSGGSNNTFIGSKAGFTNTGSGNVFIGSSTGYFESGNNKLNIHNAASGLPLIYGEFDNRIVRMNGTLEARESIANNSEFVATIRNTSNSGWANGLKIRAGQNTQSTNNRLISFRRPDDTEIGAVRQITSSSVDYNTTSDERLKTNITPTAKGLQDLMQIEVKDYVYKEDLDKPQTGFIAQQVYQHYPNAVSVGGDDVKTDPWMMDYGKMTPLLVKAVQDQQEMIASQQLQIQTLQEQNRMILEQLESIQNR